VHLVFYCGKSLEPWSPASRERGVGGSQEALIEVAERLSGLGVQVTVYNHCAAEQGDWNGVRYVPYQQFPSSGTSDVLVLWRWPSLRKQLPASFRARRIWVWMQDYVNVEELRASLPQLDRCVFVSGFQREQYSFVEAPKALVLRNGIIGSQFQQDVARDPFKVVYGSDYHRGLLPVLKAWPRIRREQPKASLTVFYGWQNQLRQAFRPAFGFSQWKQNNPVTFLLFWLKITFWMWRVGTRHLGRISHAEVAREFLSAGVWAYPAEFAETSCITAMKAQAAGAWPVIIPTAALAETVVHGYSTRGTVYESSTVEEWEGLLADALKSPPGEQRETMRAWAQQYFDWQAVAGEWLSSLQEDLGENAVGIGTRPPVVG
jgi:glycosyltransferase involved in cell wall biosynthesis